MQLDNLKPAWRQLKLLNTLPPIDSNEILSIIQGSETNSKTNLQSVLLNVVMFIILTICCQGG